MAPTSQKRDALLEAGLVLAAELSLPAVLQRIVELAAEVTGARYGALGVLGANGEISDFVTTGISEQQRQAIGHLPVGHGILGVLIGDAKPLRLRVISDHPKSVGFPPNHPPMGSFLGAPVKARGTVFGNIYLTEKQGAEEFSAEDESAVVILAAQAGVAIENAHLYEEASRRERRLEAVREITTQILEGAEPEEILELVARRARELVNADLATVATPDEGSDSLVLRVADGFHAAQLRGMVFPTQASVSGEVIQSGKPVILDDASSNERADHPVVTTGQIGPAMFVPLSVRGRAFGTLAVANRLGGRRFSQDDLSVIETFAAQASVAVEYGRAQRELKRLTLMEDRERIAKELHDGVIQSLFAVGMGLQATATISRDPQIQERIDAAVADMDRVIRDLRNYIFGLRPGILADRQLDEALRRMVEEFGEKSGVTTVADVDPRVASELSSVAGDIVQLVREALSNVGRHAGAATCRVSLRRLQDKALLEIDDDGAGFDVGKDSGMGHGLRNLQERATSLCAAFDIESSPEEGTSVRVTIPL